MDTIKLPCECRHDFQDALYGKGVRLHNVGNVASTCTVCGSKRTKAGNVTTKRTK